MTFLEAALEILKREGRPLHFKELTERAMTKKLLTFVGRTPEVTMQTQLTSAIKKAPGNPFVRVKPGVFGLLRYPEMPVEVKEVAVVEPPRRGGGAADGARAAAPGAAASGDERKRDRADKPAGETDADGRGRRRRRRGGRGRGAATVGGKEAETVEATDAAETAEKLSGARDDHARDDHDASDDAIEEPTTGGLSAEARAAALAETGVLEGDDDDALSADDDGAEDSAEEASGDVSEEISDGASGAASSANAAGAADASERVARGGGADAGDGGDEADDVFGAEDSSGTGTGTGTTEETDELGRRRRRRRRRRRGTGAEGEGTAAPGGGTEARGAFGEPAGATAAAGGHPSRESRDERDGQGQGGEDRSADSTSGGADTGLARAEGAGESRGATGALTAGSTDAGGDAGQAARKIATPVDAAIEILRAQPPGRGVHVRQLADSAIRRRLIHGEPNEAWRVIRTALATEPKDRLRNGMRPRVRSAGSGLFALARRPPDGELEKAEQVFGEARRALRERTMAALERRLAELPAGAFEALARVLLQREGFGPTTFVKRVDGTIYVEALRGRGSRPSKCLIALRPTGSPAGRRAIGELRAGIRARAHDEGLLMLAGRLGDDAIAEWKQAGSPLEIADGAALAETCARHGVGVLSATVNVDFVDADFFAELAEG